MLQFVQAPRRTVRQIGNDSTGIIEMEVRGGLTVDESDAISDLIAEGDSALVMAAKLADAIAVDENITITEAYKIVEDTVSGKELEEAAQAIKLRHAERIQAIVDTFRLSARHSNHATVTALIRSRGNRPNWTVEQTRKLDGPIYNGILKLAQDEQDAEDMPSSPPTEEDLKKQPPEPAPPQKRTGSKSSGT